MWARILNNEVVEILDLDPAGRFHPSLIFVECDENVKVGYQYQEGVFSPKPFNFGAYFEAKNRDVVAAYKQAMAPIKANYTDEDIASFPTQEAEAKAWDADSNAETPLLDYMLANRPTVDKATLVSRILQNAVMYKQIAGPAIGKKQYLEDQLYALLAQHEDAEQPEVTQVDFDDILVDFS